MFAKEISQELPKAQARRDLPRCQARGLQPEGFGDLPHRQSFILGLLTLPAGRQGYPAARSPSGVSQPGSGVTGCPGIRGRIKPESLTGCYRNARPDVPGVRNRVPSVRFEWSKTGMKGSILRLSASQTRFSEYPYAESAATQSGFRPTRSDVRSIILILRPLLPAGSTAKHRHPR